MKVETCVCGIIVGWEWSSVTEPQTESVRRWLREVSGQSEGGKWTSTWTHNIIRWKWKVRHYSWCTL